MKAFAYELSRNLIRLTFIIKSVCWAYECTHEIEGWEVVVRNSQNISIYEDEYESGNEMRLQLYIKFVIVYIFFFNGSPFSWISIQQINWKNFAEIISVSMNADLIDGQRSKKLHPNSVIESFETFKTWTNCKIS